MKKYLQQRLSAVQRCGKKAAVAVVAIGSTVAAGSASAVAVVTYTGIATGATEEITAAITAALPVAAIVIGALIGFRIFKRFARG